MSEISESRREFLKVVGYVAPVVMTLSVMPAHAGTGSGYNVEKLKGNNGLGNLLDGPPPGIAKQGLPQNDESPVQPGQPDYQGGGPK